MNIEKKVFQKMSETLAKHYSIPAIDLILYHYGRWIKAELCHGAEMPSDNEIKSAVQDICDSCYEFGSDREALAACADDSALEKRDDLGELTGEFNEPDRDYLVD